MRCTTSCTHAPESGYCGLPGLLLGCHPRPDISPSPMATAETHPGRLGGMFGWTGRRILSVGAYILELTMFVLRAFREWAQRGHVFNRATLQTLYGQIIFTGVDALPVITFLGLA